MPPAHAALGDVTRNWRGIANYRIVPLAGSGPLKKGVDLDHLSALAGARDEPVPAAREHLLWLRLIRLNGSWTPLLVRSPRGRPSSMAVGGATRTSIELHVHAGHGDAPGLAGGVR